MDTDEMREREKYELILSADGNRSALFPLVYFQRRAPESVLEHWNILVGRQPSAGFSLQAGELQVQAEDVLVWTEPREDRVSLTLYCEKLLPLMREEEDKVWWLLCTLTDQVLGEVSSIALIHDLDIVEQPRSGTAVLLSELPGKLRDMGYTRWDDAGDYLENSYIAYELEPVKDPEADWRLDVGAGSTRLPVLINDYMRSESGIMDDYHRDGIAAGFLCYPLDGFTGEGRAEEILTFRDALRESVREHAGEDAVTFLGGATGLYYGYLDLIAWDLPAVLDAAREFFAGTDMAWGGFHVFRRDVGAVRLWEQEGEPQVDAKTGSLLSAQDIEMLGSFEDGVSGYFGKMLQWLEDFIERGVETGRFTRRQARQDLKIALWYSYACNNLDEYRYYYKAVQWMKDSEKNAGGCATWYYRYSVALMYCGRLEEALDYAEKGIREEPDYPWIWLQAAKLRSHSGDKAGALEAVAHGLKLEPGDHEFLTLKGEIEAGEPLERMEYHWIDPGADRNLQQGLDEDADEKQRSISCITVNREGLERFWNIFGPKPEQYAPDGPFTQFLIVNGQTFDLVFQMNEAGMSSLSADWLERLAGWLKEGRWLERNHPDGRPPSGYGAGGTGLSHGPGLSSDGRGRMFQIFLLPDGPKRARSGPEESSGPEGLYHRRDEAVEEHIRKYFGRSGMFSGVGLAGYHVDICVVPRRGAEVLYTGHHGHGAAGCRSGGWQNTVWSGQSWPLPCRRTGGWTRSMKDERWYWPVGC
ncbi:MAG: tetratricopeptide repeat protein [Enterocloster sp.]